MVKVTDLGVSAEPMEVLDTPPLPSEIGGAMAALLTAVTGSAGPAVQTANRRDAVALTVRCLRANPGAAAALGIGATEADAAPLSEVALRLRAALRSVVNVLGPTDICSCAWDDESCAIRAEAAEALRVAQEALRG